METKTIQHSANEHFEQALSFRKSMEALKQEIKLAKAKQKIHAVRGVQMIVNASISSSNRDVSRKVVQEFDRARQLTQTAKERQYRVWRLERHIQAAMDKAHVLIKLARRARGGHAYARHQADIMLGRQP